MALFLITLLSYLAGLLGYRPSPNSLKEPPFTLKKHILQIKLTLLLGVSLIFIFLFVSNFNFTTIKKETLFLFGLNNLTEDFWLFLQFHVSLQPWPFYFIHLRSLYVVYLVEFLVSLQLILQIIKISQLNSGLVV